MSETDRTLASARKDAGSRPGGPGRPLSDYEVYLFNEGTSTRAYNALGAHPSHRGGEAGTFFAVWAPNAQAMSVIGEWNHWTPGQDRLEPRGSSGIWAGFVPGVGRGALYKYRVDSRYGGYWADKADPYAFRTEIPPRTGSVVWSLEYDWKDEAWMQKRGSRNRYDAPISIYEVHLGSWRRVPDEGMRSLSYRECADLLPAYVQSLGATHVEFLPLAEHPFYGSWGYETTGYFAPTARYGSPQDLMFLIDRLHEHEIGVILDWVPAHFPRDGHSLGYFDGTHLYEHDDPRLGHHPDWDSFIFNYGRREVRSFLLSSANFWMGLYHLDGIRVDGVASMLYRDYSRAEGEWIPNQFGGRENLEAIDFLRQLNIALYREHPDAFTMAEESTAWPMVSRPTDVGGLGFGFKWDMGWMHDTLQYLGRDPIHRKWHHNELTFRGVYTNSENFVLPLSHDEVVHGKGSLLDKFAGDPWQKFAQLRLLLGYQFALPGKKLLFMGDEFGQWREWNHDESLDWHLVARPAHAGIQRWVADLNRLIRSEPSLHAWDHEPQGFQWVDSNDADQSMLSFLRWGPGPSHPMLIVANFTPTVRSGYEVGAPWGGRWTEVLNSDATFYGGEGVGNLGSVESWAEGRHGLPHHLSLNVPPLGIVFLRAAP